MNFFAFAKLSSTKRGQWSNFSACELVYWQKLLKTINLFFQEGDETAISEWSVRTHNHHLNSIMLPSEADLDDDNGRVSVYFKTKSKELGKLCGEGSTRVSRPLSLHKFRKFPYSFIVL